MPPLLFVLGLAFVTTVLVANVDAIKCIEEAPNVPREPIDCSLKRRAIDKCFMGRDPDGRLVRSCGYGYICDSPMPGHYCCNDKDYCNDSDVPAGPPEVVVTPGPLRRDALMCYTGECYDGQGEAVECPGSVDKCTKCGGPVTKRGCDFDHLCGVEEDRDCCSSDYCNSDDTPGPPDPPEVVVTPGPLRRDALMCYTGGCDGGQQEAHECPRSVYKCAQCGGRVTKRGCDVEHLCGVDECCGWDYCNGVDDNRVNDNNPRSGALASTPPVPLTVAVIATIIAFFGT